MAIDMSKSSDVQSFGRDQVVNIINSVIGKVKGPQELSRDLICRELTGLKDTIESLRQQLHVAAPGDISQMHIPTARDELDAVIDSTEQATNSIMTACESVLTQMEKAPPELGKNVEAEIVRIYEACTFQDITGQRISKVIKTLKEIDGKVCQLLGVIGQPETGYESKSESESLLNGPQLPKDAISQDEIDRLLADF